MRLVIEEHREAIKRYSHIRPTRGWRVKPCAARCPGTSHACSQAKDHRGPHVAHGFPSKVVAVWDAGTGVKVTREATSQQSGGRVSKSGPPIGLQSRRPTGMLDAVWKQVVRAASSVEQIALFIMLLAFVWFAIEWLLLILA